MTENKTKPTSVSVNDFLSTVSDVREAESNQLIKIMSEISGQHPVMWGPSIIGFGSVHYKYDTGREGDMPELSFSPRKVSITIYFSEGFQSYDSHLSKLGKFKSSVSCLYINRLEDIDLSILKKMLIESYAQSDNQVKKPNTVEEYINQVPRDAKIQFNNLRKIVRDTIPKANEVLSYGIIGYKIDDKRARVFISGWKDHVAMYPIPKDELLVKELNSYIKGKGTLWFSLDSKLPKKLIEQTVKALIK